MNLGHITAINHAYHDIIANVISRKLILSALLF
jgi:hypothetical protein